MEYLKIVVNKDEDKAKDIISLFGELDYYQSRELHRKYYGWIIGSSEGEYTNDRNYFNNHHAKLVTVEQLKDMVVLKRNDAKDATNVDSIDYKWYVASDEKHYRYQGNIWVYQPYVDCLELKPIENPMKEYLRKEKDGSYSMVEGLRKVHPSWIDVPSGAEVAAVSDCCDVYFWKNNGNLNFDKHNKKWSNQGNLKTNIEKYGYKIVWQRFVEKEYINKNTGEYRKTDGIVKNPQWIEIPEGAEILCEFNNGEKENRFVFYKQGDDCLMSRFHNGYQWGSTGWVSLSDFLVERKEQMSVVWQRSTQPEPLPFIDDEPMKDKKIYTYEELNSMSDDDIVNHPNHYTQGKVECIDALESATVNKVGIEAICTANAIKYLWRYEEKNGLEDVKKAQWYINKLIDVLQQAEHS